MSIDPSSLTPSQKLALTHAELQIAAILLALEETTGMRALVEKMTVSARYLKPTILLTSKKWT